MFSTVAALSSDFLEARAAAIPSSIDIRHRYMVDLDKLVAIVDAGSDTKGKAELKKHCDSLTMEDAYRHSENAGNILEALNK